MAPHRAVDCTCSGMAHRELNSVNDHVQKVVDIGFDYIVAAVKRKEGRFFTYEVKQIFRKGRKCLNTHEGPIPRTVPEWQDWKELASINTSAKSNYQEGMRNVQFNDHQLVRSLPHRLSSYNFHHHSSPHVTWHDLISFAFGVIILQWDGYGMTRDQQFHSCECSSFCSSSSISIRRNC